MRAGKPCPGSTGWNWGALGQAGEGVCTERRLTAARDRQTLRRGPSRSGCPRRPDPLQLSKSTSEGLVSPRQDTKNHFARLQHQQSPWPGREPSMLGLGHSPSPPAGSGSACGLLPSGRARLLQRQDMGRGLEAPSLGGDTPWLGQVAPHQQGGVCSQTHGWSWSTPGAHLRGAVGEQIFLRDTWTNTHALCSMKGNKDKQQRDPSTQGQPCPQPTLPSATPALSLATGMGQRSQRRWDQERPLILT